MLWPCVGPLLLLLQAGTSEGLRTPGSRAWISRRTCLSGVALAPAAMVPTSARAVAPEVAASKTVVVESLPFEALAARSLREYLEGNSDDGILSPESARAIEKADKRTAQAEAERLAAKQQAARNMRALKQQSSADLADSSGSSPQPLATQSSQGPASSPALPLLAPPPPPPPLPLPSLPPPPPPPAARPAAPPPQQASPLEAPQQAPFFNRPSPLPIPPSAPPPAPTTTPTPPAPTSTPTTGSSPTTASPMPSLFGFRPDSFVVSPPPPAPLAPAASPQKTSETPTLFGLRPDAFTVRWRLRGTRTGDGARGPQLRL